MTFQRKLLLGFSLMVLPALLVGAEAIRSNRLERRALDALGESMARTRTYAELETAMFDQSEIIWRYLSGIDPAAQREFQLAADVVRYWQDRWRAELRPDECAARRRGVAHPAARFKLVADSIFSLADSGRRPEAFALAQRELKGRLQPALTQMNREIYRRARESSVRGAYARLEEILAGEGRTLLVIIALTLAGGLLGSWLISRRLARPIRELTGAMAVVGSGQLDHPVNATTPETRSASSPGFRPHDRQPQPERGKLERTQAQLVQSEKLASIGEMAAAVAHGLRNPLASLRAAAQLVRAPSRLAVVARAPRRHHRGGRPARPPDQPPAELLPAGALPPDARSVSTGLVENLLPAFAEPMRERGSSWSWTFPATSPSAGGSDAAGAGAARAGLQRPRRDARRRPAPDRRRGDERWPARRRGRDRDRPTPARGSRRNVLPSVCEPFFTTRQEGTGLGLAIAKRYVEQNGGRLEIDSRPARAPRCGLPAAARERRPHERSPCSSWTTSGRSPAP